jgi:hypothetical protein
VPQREALVERFIERQNIARFTDQLRTETDLTKRKMLQTLLAEENAKEASHVRRSLGDQ